MRKHRGGVSFALMEIGRVKSLYTNTNTTNTGTRKAKIIMVAIAMKNHHLALLSDLCYTIRPTVCWHVRIISFLSLLHVSSGTKQYL